jgi:hypothetical protein
MAAQEVYSLFGIKSPAQVRAERDAQYAAELSRATGGQKLGMGIARGLGALFGAETPEMQQANQMKEVLAGIDTTDPAQIRAAAQAVSAFAPEAAIQMGEYALKLEKDAMGEVVNAPVRVGTKPIYKQEFNEAGLPTGKYIQVGEEPLFRDVPHRRTKDGLVPMLDFNQQTAGGAAPPPVPDATQPDFITNEQGVVVRNPAKTAGATAGTQGQVVTSNVPPEAADRIGMQGGPRGGFEGATGVGIAPPPKIQGEVTYVNPQVLGEEITALESQLSAMPRTAQGRKDLQKQIAKLKQQQRKFSSRSSGGQNRRNK